MKSESYTILILGLLCFGLGLFQNSVWAAQQNSLELHSGSVKLVRNGKSRVLRKAGQTYALLPNDRLHTGKRTRVSLYLQNKENTVKLFSRSFFKLDASPPEEDETKTPAAVALLTGKGNFSVKPLPETPETTAEKKTPKKKLTAKLGGRLTASLTGRKKLRRKKKRFKVRTVSAIVGVRGTEFVVATVGDSTNLLALSGEVSLASPEVPDYEVDVTANQISSVREGSGPSVPVTVTPQESGRIAQADGSAAFGDSEFGPAEPVGALRQRLDSGEETPLFEEDSDPESDLLEQLDRLGELETLVENAEDAIDAAKSKTLILTMTFQNR